MRLEVKNTGKALFALYLVCNLNQAIARSKPKAPFEGTAQKVSDLRACVQLVPKDVSNPFTRGAPDKQAIGNYRIVGCWKGLLKGKPFLLTQYWSNLDDGGGIAVQYGTSAAIGYLSTHAPPTDLWFSMTYVCHSENAGARFKAIDIVSRVPLDDDVAERVCP